MSDTGSAGEYSTEEIQRLLRQIRAQHQSGQSDPGPAATPKPRRSKPEPGLRRELSLEEILQKIEREI